MINVHASDVDHLLHKGHSAAQQGDTCAARLHFRRATEIAPHCAEAWHELSLAVPVLAERRMYLQRALEIDPTHPEAQADLQAVDTLLASGAQLDPAVQQAKRRERNVIITVPPEQITAPSATAYCGNHPNRVTDLHCTQCDQPICGQCMVSAAVGQLCKACARARRPVNYQVPVRSLAVAVPVVTVLAAAMSVLEVAITAQLPFISFFLYVLSVPPAAGLIVYLLDRLTRSKRGKVMQCAVSVGVCLGTAPVLLFAAVFVSILDAVLLFVFAALLVSAVAAQLR